MKKILILAVMMVFLASTGGVANALTYSDQLTVINAMADYLKNNQNDDGGWDWTQPGDESGDTDSASGSTTNAAGATARGLVAAYNRTGNTDYLNAAIATAEYIVDTTTTEVGGHKDTLFFKDVVTYNNLTG